MPKNIKIDYTDGTSQTLVLSEDDAFLQISMHPSMSELDKRAAFAMQFPNVDYDAMKKKHAKSLSFVESLLSMFGGK